MKGWHFVGDKLRDGSPIPPDGEWLAHEGDVKICQSGLHYSERIIDALDYAPGSTICRVEVRDVVEQHNDKGVARERRILWRVDGEELLREFARKCALDVIHLWYAPDVVREYLETGDASKRDAARDAARDTAWAAPYAAWAAGAAVAAWDAAWAAACAARDATRAARDAQNKRFEAMVREAKR